MRSRLLLIVLYTVCLLLSKFYHPLFELISKNEVLFLHQPQEIAGGSYRSRVTCMAFWVHSKEQAPQAMQSAG